jgi:hypothetical protein
VFDKFLPALGVIAGIILTQIFNYFQRRADSKERFFYEVYPKRIAVYEDAIKELAAMSKRDGDILNQHLPREAVLKIIEDDLHTLDGLRARIDFYGSPAARSIIGILRVDVGSQFGTVALEPDNFVHECIALLDIVDDARNHFLEITRKETGANLVDKRIEIFLKGIEGVKGIGCKKQRKHLANQKGD